MLNRKLFIALSLSLVLGSIRAADKELPPEGGAPRDFRLPEKSVVKLDNGLSATLVPYGVLPKATLAIVVRAGNINESANQVWLADLTGDLLREGTTSRDARKLAEEIGAMGGTLTVTVSPDQTTVTTDVLSEFADKALLILADVVRNPLLPESELDRLKRDRLRQLSIAKSQPESIAQERFRKLLYPDHPYGRLFPTEQMLGGYTIADVRGFYQRNFGATRTRLYVCGQFDRTAMEASIRKSLEGWGKGPAAESQVPTPVAKKQYDLLDRPKAPQSTVYFGLPVPAPGSADYIPLLVTNSLLGGSFASRITSNIREQKGYTYSPYSSVSSRYRDAHWVQFASVSTPVTAAALKEIVFEVDRLHKEPPSPKELVGIQNYMAGTFVLRNSSRSGIIDQLAFLELHGLGDDYLRRYVQSVHAVKPEDVQRITREYIRPKDMTLVITGDKSQIEGQLAEFLKTW